MASWVRIREAESCREAVGARLPGPCSPVQSTAGVSSHSSPHGGKTQPSRNADSSHVTGQGQ